MRTPPLFLVASALSLLLTPASAEEKKRDSPEKPAEDQSAEIRKEPRQPEESTRRKPDGPPSPKRTWVGVATTGIDPSLRRHLELEEGFGIQIIEVMPDSPAGKAGLRENDIITHFEDQHLISPEHLSLLVRTKSSGAKVSLAIIRKGKEEVLEVTLGETDDHTFNRWHPPANRPQGYHYPPLSNHNDPEWQESIKRHQDMMREWMDRNRPESKEGSLDRGKPGGSPGEGRKAGEPEKAPPGNRPPSVSVSPGFPLRVFGMEGVLKIDNEKGELTLTRKDGKQHLEIKDAAGKSIFEGSFDPAAGTKSLPEEARRQLEIMKLENFEVLVPEGPPPHPEETGESKENEDSGTSGEIL